ncbi:hypothetical protein HK103_000061 [Boothiomyces macroporosus]|uniref:rRNA-processing protein n=1 Tax=Boothiomyces macroporosus TaxID=261099 RepID=A0AAD5UQD9_9FUNG|nr:hypothetical protein HK103_000061 [Boothiomyces macroporosus]
MTAAVRGNNVSGRPWKSVQEPKRSLVKNNASKVGFKARQELLKKQNIVKQLVKEKEREKLEEKERLKKELEERKKRKLENEQKAEVVQKISAAKLKRMKKKQLRQLQKKSA